MFPLSYLTGHKFQDYIEKMKYNNLRTKNMRSLYFVGTSPGGKIRTGDFSSTSIASGILDTVIYIRKTEQYGEE